MSHLEMTSSLVISELPQNTHVRQVRRDANPISSLMKTYLTSCVALTPR